MDPPSGTGRRPGRRAPLVILTLLVALAMALGAGAARAPAVPPPGMNTLFFSPSRSGGCSDGQVSALGEASAPPGQSPTSPTVVTPWNAGLSLLNSPGGPFWTLDGAYASGMAATSWNYSFGYPWQDEPELALLGGTVPGWSTVVYFTSSCGSPQNLENYILAQCYQANGSGPLGGCLAGADKMRCDACPGPQAKFAWGAFTTAGNGASWLVGAGLAFDTIHNTLYFTTAPNGCTGEKTCTVSVWSSPAATMYGEQLSPTLVTTLPGISSPLYMAVDPIGQTLYLTGPPGAEVISVPTSGGQASTVLSGSQWISGSTVVGMAFDPSTGLLYVMSPQTGYEMNQITQVPVGGGSPSIVFTNTVLQNAMGGGEVSGLTVDPANAFVAWGLVPHGPGNTGSIMWGPLDATPSGGPSSLTYGWAGSNDGVAAYIWALAIAGGVGTCQYEGTTFPCPTTTVGASGVTTREAADGTVAIPIRAYQAGVNGPAPPAQASEHGGVAAAPVRGPMVVAFRDRRSGRTLATVRPGFTVRVNAQGVRRVEVPAAAREALRSGHLEVRVRTRNAGTSQGWRTRTLTVRPR